MIGIYKITSPTKKVYIGQSINIEKRIKDYSNLKNCIEQPKLYNSFLKHKVENHIFEIICECEITKLNELERYYQELYNVIQTGLNCVLTNTQDRCGFLSKETKLKISNSKKGQGKGIKKSIEFKQSVSKNNKLRVWKQESKLKLSKSLKGKFKGELNPFFGKTHTKESLLKMSESSKNRKPPMLGKKHSIETKNKIKEKNKLKTFGKNSNAKIVLDISNGIYYECVKELAIILNINRHTLSRKIRGDRKNNTNYIYV
jgi:group I intron endonuclease